jgi:hypothetical protein
VRDVTRGNFGLLIAYLLPGFTALLGISTTSEWVRSWLTTSASGSPTVGGFLYSTIASLIAGMLISTVRWAVVDRLHHATGIRPPRWHFKKLQDCLQAFELLVESHYRYYQFYANMATGGGVAYMLWRFHRIDNQSLIAMDLGFLVAEWLLLLGSRDTLRKYYERGNQLIGQETPKRSVMSLVDGRGSDQHKEPLK